MRSPYELDCYFESERFRKRLDFLSGLGEGYDIAGSIFIVRQFELMQYHYGIIQHYILTGKYNPEKQNRHQIEIIDYTNRQLAGTKELSDKEFDELGLREPQDGVHILLPPGIRQKDILSFFSDNHNSKVIKDVLEKAYKNEPGNKRTFRPVRRIDTHLEIVDKIDENGGPTPKLILELSLEHGIDESDISKLYRRLGPHKNPFSKPV